MRCPVCDATSLVEINLTVRASKLVMHSCSQCEHRWWDRDGDTVALDGVLDLARV